MSISWPNVRIEPDEIVEFIVIARWGSGSSYTPQITMTSTPSLAYSTLDYPVAGTLSHAGGESCYLFVIIDRAKATTYVSRQPRIGDFTETIRFSDGAVTPGNHTLRFYAVTDSGTFSEPWTLTLDVQVGPTAPRTRTRPVTPTRTPDPTPRPTEDTRMPAAGVAGIVAAALIVLAAVTGRCVFWCCNFMGKHAYYDGSEHSSSYSGHGDGREDAKV
jgi:hypothetical protein